MELGTSGGGDGGVIQTYPEMNEKIKHLLGLDKDDPIDMYAAARIEELEAEVKRLKETNQPITVLRIKKGVPTIIRFDGREYILRSPDQFNMQPKPRRGERNVQ